MKRVTTQLVDDLDGTVIDDEGVTIEFGLDGRRYEIDLSRANADRLKEALAPYVRAGREVGRTSSSRPRSAGSRRRGSDDLAAIREWANSNGYSVGLRGRIPNDVHEAYRAAH